MDAHEEDAGPLAGRSARLIRQGSALLAGGAALIPPEMPEAVAEAEPPLTQQEGERRPILRRQATRRVQTQQQVVTRLATETWKRWWPLFIFLFLVLMAAYGVILYYMIIHFLAVCNNWTKPCDQLLHYYLFTQFLISFFNSQVTNPQLGSRYGPKGLGAAFVIGLVMGWSCIGWGLMMVWDCKTCQETNPELYKTTKDYIYAQIVFTVIASVILGFASAGALRFWGMMETRMHPGCPAAIAKMARVQPDDKELIDPEDNKVMDCPICQEPLNAKGMTALRTDCDHHFHVECLEQWAKSHLDCPMCRTKLGDENNEDTEEKV